MGSDVLVCSYGFISDGAATAPPSNATLQTDATVSRNQEDELYAADECGESDDEAQCSDARSLSTVEENDEEEEERLQIETNLLAFEEGADLMNGTIQSPVLRENYMAQMGVTDNKFDLSTTAHDDQDDEEADAVEHRTDSPGLSPQQAEDDIGEDLDDDGLERLARMLESVSSIPLPVDENLPANIEDNVDGDSLRVIISSAVREAISALECMSDAVDRFFLKEGWIVSVLSSIAIFLALWMALCLADEPRGQYSQHVRSDSPSSFIDAFIKEIASCQSTCCSGLFILTGDADSHEPTVRRALLRSRMWRSAHIPDVWSPRKLMRWVDGSEFPDSAKVIVVKDADSMSAKEIRQTIKFGQKQCRPGKYTNAKVVVLSTSFGASRLDDVDEALSGPDLLDFDRPDWLAIREVVLNRRGIIHQVRGDRPFKTFRQFFEARRSDPSLDGLSTQALSWFADFFGESRHTARIELDQASVSGLTPMQFLDHWLESKRSKMVLTDSAKRFLAGKVQQRRSLYQIRMWLDHQFNVWTKNGSCESVLFRPLASNLQAYNLACEYPHRNLHRRSVR